MRCSLRIQQPVAVVAVIGDWQSRFAGNRLGSGGGDGRQGCGRGCRCGNRCGGQVESAGIVLDFRPDIA